MAALLPELGVSELARRLGLATSTVHRVLATLAAEKLVERTPAGYRLGLAVFDLGASVAPRGDLHEAALPVMATLRASTGETVQLAVLDGLESVYVDRLEMVVQERRVPPRSGTFVRTTEIRAVAFDVLQEINPSYELRVAGLAVATTLLFGLWMIGSGSLLVQDGAKAKRLAKEVRKRREFRKQHAAPNFVEAIRAYLRRDFHPLQDTACDELARAYARAAGLS